MRGHGTQFSHKMEAAVAALVTHRTVEEAAQAVGISASTLKRWKKLPEFQVAYLAVRREAVFQTSARLQQNSGVAAAALLKAMADPTTSTGVRVRAATCVLQLAYRSLEQEDVEVRLAAVERAVAASAKGEPENPKAQPDTQRKPMQGHGTQFARKMEAAAAALVTHRSVEEAAQAVGVSASTLKRWKKLPEFQAAWMAARREAVFQTSARLQQNVGAASAVLFKVMAEPTTSAAVRVRAATCILQLAYRSLEQEDLEMRVAALERVMGISAEGEQNLPKAA